MFCLNNWSERIIEIVLPQSIGFRQWIVHNIESEEQMDNQNITVNMENLSEEERSTLLSLVKKSNKLKSKVWKPE